MDQEAFDRELAKMKAQFALQLGERFALAREQLAGCERDPAAAEPLVQLHRTLHSLAGAAGTFGMARVGKGAAAIEAMLAGLQDRPQRTAADFAAVGVALAQLERLAADAGDGP